MKFLSLVAFISLCSPALGIGGAIQGLEDATEIHETEFPLLSSLTNRDDIIDYSGVKTKRISR